MVNTNAVCIQRGTVRKTRIQLCGPRWFLACRRTTGISCRITRLEDFGTVWHRERVQERMQSRHGIVTRVQTSSCGTGVRNSRERSLWQPKPKPLIRKEEEGLILQDRPIESPSEIILSFFRLGL